MCAVGTGRREKRRLLAPLPEAVFESKQLIKKLVIKLLKIAEMTSVNSSPYAELHKN